jgi:hypothetical protein
MYRYINSEELDSMTEIVDKVAMDYYFEVMEDIVKLRKQRASIYGDDWITNEVEAKVWLLWEKAQRATHIVKYNPDTLMNEYERLEDTLKDSVNYAIFALCILRKKRDVLAAAKK